MTAPILNYVLHLPPNVPAETFWSITLYDVDTRCIIKNEQQIVDRSSRMGLLENKGGSIDLYFGPNVPESNWIGTIDDLGFFTVLRLFSPTAPYFDKTWKPDDIVKIG